MIDIRLHAYLRALAIEKGAQRVGPFVVSLDAHSANPYRNYAIPDDHACPVTKQIEALVAAFTTRGRTPRLEYLPGLCPAVRPALFATGFTAERCLPVMVCHPAQVLDVVAPSGIELLLAHTEDQLRVAAEVQNDAYGADATEEADVARLRGVVASGGLVALARDATSGEPAGSGLCTAPHEGVSELAAVGVRKPFRRRGIAAALTALLTRHGESVGITTPFLTPEDEATERIYRRAGYTRSTEMLHISFAEASSLVRPDTPIQHRVIACNARNTQ